MIVSLIIQMELIVISSISNMDIIQWTVHNKRIQYSFVPGGGENWETVRDINNKKNAIQLGVAELFQNEGCGQLGGTNLFRNEGCGHFGGGGHFDGAKLTSCAEDTIQSGGSELGGYSGGSISILPHFVHVSPARVRYISCEWHFFFSGEKRIEKEHEKIITRK